MFRQFSGAKDACGGCAGETYGGHGEARAMPTRISALVDVGDSGGELLLEIAPKVMRHLGLEVGDTVDLRVVNDTLVLKKIPDRNEDPSSQ